MPSIWQKLRADFPITKKYICLDHASGGPVPRPVSEVIQRHYREVAEEADFAWMRWIRQRENVREKIAKFIHADPSEVTFVQSTSQGMNWIAELLSDKGKVLTNESEFPSSTLPWIWRKAKIVWQKPENYSICLSKLKLLLSPSVKTIVTSFVQYATGFRQDLEALGRLKGNRFLAVNATQGFGALPVNVKKWNCDFMVTNSYKWLMAGYGSGVLYIRKKWLEKFQPASIGWRSMNEPERMDNKRIDVRPDAGRYEWGCPSFASIFAAGAAVEYLSEIGIEKIENRILELTGYLIERLKKKGFEIASPEKSANRSGIVIVKVKDPQKMWKKLMAQKIYVSPRGEGIRVSPHFYNSYEEMDRFIEGLSAR